MVGDDDDRGGREEVQLPKAIEKPADRGVGIRDLTVVRRVAMRRGEGGGRRIRRVRIE